MRILGAFMSRFLVLTGTTGVPLIERGLCRLGRSSHSFLLQTKNKIDFYEGTNISHFNFLEMGMINCSEFDGVIGHCGAGTVFWALENKLPLLAVIDLNRPDDHQSDLGGWLKKYNFALVIENRVPRLGDLDDLVSRDFQEYTADPFCYEKIYDLL